MKTQMTGLNEILLFPEHRLENECLAALCAKANERGMKLTIEFIRPGENHCCVTGFATMFVEEKVCGGKGGRRMSDAEYLELSYDLIREFNIKVDRPAAVLVGFDEDPEERIDAANESARHKKAEEIAQFVKENLNAS